MKLKILLLVAMLFFAFDAMIVGTHSTFTQQASYSVSVIPDTRQEKDIASPGLPERQEAVNEPRDAQDADGGTQDAQDADGGTQDAQDAQDADGGTQDAQDAQDAGGDLENTAEPEETDSPAPHAEMNINPTQEDQ